MTTALTDGRELILASTSVFRRELLAKLGLPFTAVAPQVDETPQDRETAPDLAHRLALAKARAVAQQHPNALVIGSDQVALLDNAIVSKSGSHDRAVAQLQRASGKSMIFYTGLALIDSDSKREQIAVIPFSVHFRHLSESQIETYLQREQPYQCAGSFKAEALGIALFERLEGDDPNSLIGLPLIKLCDMLAAENIAVL